MLGLVAIFADCYKLPFLCFRIPDAKRKVRPFSKRLDVVNDVASSVFAFGLAVLALVAVKNANFMSFLLPCSRPVKLFLSAFGYELKQFFIKQF